MTMPKLTGLIPRILLPVVAVAVAAFFGAWLALATGSGAPVLLALLAGSLIATVAVSGWLLRRYVTHPIARIDTALHRRVDGDAATMVPVESADELGHLAMTMNEVIATAFSTGGLRPRHPEHRCRRHYHPGRPGADRAVQPGG